MAPPPRAEPGPPRIAVACSGGRDSIALLHVTARAARPLGVEVVALHVHHGLMSAADAWLAQLRAQCAQWAEAGLPVRLVFTRLTERPAPGDSVEAWARGARYRALAEMARAAGCDAVLLAHHRRDQAETFLLQALRGAGATHAWCEVFLPGLGWLEFDPTNGLAESADLIPIAVTRIPAQAAPVSGSIQGFANSTMTVRVEVSAHDAYRAVA